MRGAGDNAIVVEVLGLKHIADACGESLISIAVGGARVSLCIPPPPVQPPHTFASVHNLLMETNCGAAPLPPFRYIDVMRLRTGGCCSMTMIYQFARMYVAQNMNTTQTKKTIHSVRFFHIAMYLIYFSVLLFW